MVTHDRVLINDVSQRISELCPETKAFVHFTGGYQGYLEQQEKKRLRALKEREKQEKSLEILAQQQAKLKASAKKIVKRPPNDKDKISFNFNRERGQKSAGAGMKDAQKKMERLSDHLTEVPRERKTMDFAFPSVSRARTPASLSVEKLSMGYTQPHTESLFKDLSFPVSPGERLVIQGSNGSGKTTLLKIIAGLLEPQSGTLCWSGDVHVGYLDQEQENLNLDETAQ